MAREKVKLTKAEAMLASIANTERQQVVQQADGIYQARITALLEDHGVSFKEKPNIDQDGQDLFLSWEIPDAPIGPALVP